MGVDIKEIWGEKGGQEYNECNIFAKENWVSLKGYFSDPLKASIKGITFGSQIDSQIGNLELQRLWVQRKIDKLL